VELARVHVPYGDLVGGRRGQDLLVVRTPTDGCDRVLQLERVDEPSVFGVPDIDRLPVGGQHQGVGGAERADVDRLFRRDLHDLITGGGAPEQVDARRHALGNAL